METRNPVSIRLAVVASVLIVSATQAADKPNIVWLTTEDNSACWYRLYNDQGAAMPNVERLARHGLVFNNAYSCGPVCSVARSTIISGCYVSRLGAQYHRKQLPVAMPDGIKMFPWYLRQAGYYTTNNSKEDYNFRRSDVRQVWDESSADASYRKRQAGQPFFHVQNFGKTHESQLFPSVPDAELKTDPSTVQLFPYHPDTPLFRNKYAHYLDLQTVVDAQMGNVIDQLEADGLMDDTFIFHFGDHGGVLPGSKGYAHNDGLQVALVVYVPNNWQHLAPAARGSRIDGFVEFVDLSATVLHLAGVDIPAGIDGRPVLGEGVTLSDLQDRDTALGYAERFDEKYDMVRFLRKGKYTYWRNYQPFNFDGLHNEYRYRQPAFAQWRNLYHAGKLDAVQSAFFQQRPPECLYDLRTDPHEVHNLAADPAYSLVLKEMRSLLQRRLKSMPDVGMIPEPVFVAQSDGEGQRYGEEHRELIASLFEIADLQLRPFPEAQRDIAEALDSSEPLERYWALITCSRFGRQAAPFFQKARRMADADSDPLVRTRAAEFLGLAGAADPRPVLIDVLNATSDPIAANLILNSVVLLRDGPAGMEFDVAEVASASWINTKTVAQRRVEYLGSK